MFSTNGIAILLAAYNGEKYIEEQLDSLLAQSNHEWELYIHDDGSDDRTVQLIAKYIDSYPEKIHLIEGASCGSAKENFFNLLNNVNADYYMFCDQDDVWLENKIDRTFQDMTEMEKAVSQDLPILVYTDLKVTDQNLNVVSESMNSYQKLKPDENTFKNLLVQGKVSGSTVMINRACAEMVLKTHDTSSIIMHDWWCSLVAAKYGVIKYIDEALILYRQHDRNVVGAKNVNSFKYIAARIKNFKDIRNNIRLTRNQAGAFTKAYHSDELSIEYQYSHIQYMNKIQRIFFYYKNNMWKSGLVRNIGLILFG